MKFELQSDIRQHLDNFQSEEREEGTKDDILRWNDDLTSHA